jgi:hypothetical protein
MTQSNTQDGICTDLELSSGDRHPTSIATTCEDALENTKSKFVIATHCHDGRKKGLHLIYDPADVGVVALVDFGVDAMAVRATGSLNYQELIETDSDDIRSNSSEAQAWLDYLCEGGPDKYHVEEDCGDGEIKIRMKSHREGQSATVRANLE